MAEHARKPLAQTDRRLATRLERREIQRTFRFTESEDRALQEAAIEEREDFTTYCRSCLLTGHSMKHAQRLMKRASG